MNERLGAFPRNPRVLALTEMNGAAFIFDRQRAKSAVKSVMVAQGAQEGAANLEEALSKLSTKKIRKELEASWGVELKEFKLQIDELVMSRCCKLRENVVKAPTVASKKRAGTTPLTADVGGGHKKKARVDPTTGKAAAAAAPASKLEAEEARLLALVKRCKLSRPRVLSKVGRPPTQH